MKKIFTIFVTCLLAVCALFVGCCGINYNAVIVDDVTYKTEWIENNYTYGGWVQSLDSYDKTSPETRTYVVENQTQLEEIFENFPAVDFEKEMVLVHCYTTCYVRQRVLKKAVLNDGVLQVDFNVVRGKFMHADAAMPHTRVVAIKLDKVECAEVQVAYKGQ